METMINKIPIDLKTKKLSTNNRFKQYLLFLSALGRKELMLAIVVKIIEPF